VSSVKDRLAAAEVLPAASVCRTCTVLLPSAPNTEAAIDAAVPAAQVVPPSRLYCQVAPDSSPPTFTWPLRVMPSVVLLPVSDASANTGAATVVSSVKDRIAAAERFPATSV